MKSAIGAFLRSELSNTLLHSARRGNCRPSRRGRPTRFWNCCPGGRLARIPWDQKSFKPIQGPEALEAQPALRPPFFEHCLSRTRLEEILNVRRRNRTASQAD